MKPRDISVTQLWVEDLNDSLSSLESFSEEEARADESSDDEEEEVQAKRDRRQSISSRRMVLPRLNHNKSSSKRQTPSGLRRRATFHDGCLQQQLPAVQVQTPTSKQRISTRRRRNSTFNRSTTSPPPEPSLAVSASPMRKFRMGSHISDSALSASRSCASQRRRVSQANAKWDVNNNAFQSRRSATLRGGRGSNVFQPTLVPVVSTHGNNHNNNSSNHSPYHGAGGDSECDCCTANSSKKGSRISHHSFAETDSLVSSAVGSRDTRWSTSTHTRDAASVLCRPPRRQNSGRSWQSCGSSKCSVCSLAAEDDDDEEEDNDTNNANAKEPKEEEEAQPQDKQPEQPPQEQQGPTAEEAIQEEGSDDEEQEPVAAFLARQGAPRSRPQLPHRQKSFKSKTSYSMEDAIQEAIAAQTLEDFATTNDEDGGSWLPSVEFPQMAIPANIGNSPRPDSLVSLMNPFQQIKPRNRSPLQSADGNISIKSASSAESDLSRLSQLFA